MKLIINTSNLHAGGGIQVAYSFINECISFPNNQYHVFLCPTLNKQIRKIDFPKNFFFYEFVDKPFFSLKGLSTLKRIKKLESNIKADCVFTVFGPSYWTPKSVHLLGYAIPHFLYTDSPFYKAISFKEKLKWKLIYITKRFYFLANANYYHVETEDARVRLSKYLNRPLNSIFSVSNTYNSIYNSNIVKSVQILPNRSLAEFRFVCISAYYSHKNIEILNKVIPLLKMNGMTNIKFVLTIDSKIFESIFSDINKSQIYNIGAIDIENCPTLYQECDALFLPTLLECFSANYPESMKMQKPILTSDLTFGRNICGEAALFFNPIDENDIFEKICLLVNDKQLQNEMISKGNIQLLNFNTSKERAEEYLRICKMISEVK